MPRLRGSATTSYQISVSFSQIADTQGVEALEESPVSLTFRRGDAKADGSVDIIDALFIAQFTVGIKTAAQLNAVNAASVNYDGASGDKIDIVDALFIAQYTVLLKNAFFQ